MKSFIYFQHIDWNWIPQRPQFIAQSLEQHFSSFNPKVFFIKSIRKRYLVENDINLEKRPISVMGVPYWNFPLFRWISCWTIGRKLRNLDLSRSIVYITHPRVFAALKNTEILFLVYDCMDDSIAMTSKFKSYVMDLESDLVSRADLVIVSSVKLQSNTLVRYKKESKLVLNGIDSGFMHNFLKPTEDREIGKAIFFGVIGSWIDQDFLVKFSKINNVQLLLYGPIHGELLEELRPFYQGVLPQEQLYEVASRCHLALLPYEVSEFTETINPVKMYEYIGLRLPVIGTKLSSLEEFEGLYVPIDTSNDITEMIGIASGIYPKHEGRRLEILKTCDWDIRGSRISEEIRSGLEAKALKQTC